MHYMEFSHKFSPNPEPRELMTIYEEYKEYFGEAITLRDVIEICKVDAIECVGNQLSELSKLPSMLEVMANDLNVCGFREIADSISTLSSAVYGLKE